MNVPNINFRVTINGHDATRDLSPYLERLRYKDNRVGKADELELVVDNSDFRFSNKWFFSPGMLVKAWIEDMYCGEFSIDEPYESGPPDIAGFKAQSALFSGPLRTKTSFTHSKKTLRQIVEHYAKAHSLKVVGSIPDINLQTVIQHRQSDIDFLHRLADLYGCTCAIKGKNLVFDTIENMWKSEAKIKIVRKDVKSYRFYTSLADTSDAAISVYHDIKQEKVNGSVAIDAGLSGLKSVENKYNIQQQARIAMINNTPDYPELDSDYMVKTNVVSVVHKTAESAEEAALLAKGELLKKRRGRFKGTLTLPGNQYLIAGNSTNLQEWGKRSGLWVIESSEHEINKKGGYETTIEVTQGSATGGAKVPDPSITGDKEQTFHWYSNKAQGVSTEFITRDGGV